VPEDAQVSYGEFITALRYNYKKRTALKFYESHCECTCARSNPFGNGRRRRAAVSELAYFALYSGQRIALRGVCSTV
jgi:hypothetical protein